MQWWISYFWYGSDTSACMDYGIQICETSNSSIINTSSNLILQIFRKNHIIIMFIKG